jgi:hypothetical protein
MIKHVKIKTPRSSECKLPLIGIGQINKLINYLYENASSLARGRKYGIVRCRIYKPQYTVKSILMQVEHSNGTKTKKLIY